MLSIMKQYKMLFSQLLGSAFAEKMGGSNDEVNVGSNLDSRESKEIQFVKLNNIPQAELLLSEVKGTELSKGSENTIGVIRLQKLLKEEGYDMGTYLNKQLFGEHAEPGIDADFGSTTEKALRLFQAKIGVPATGEFDLATQETLQSIIDMQNARDLKIQQKQILEKKAKEEKAELVNSMLDEDGNYIEKNTKEFVGKANHTFLGIDLGEVDRAQALRGTNIDSLIMLLDHDKLNILVQELKTSLGTDDLSNYTFKSAPNNNFDQIIPILREYGYDIPVALFFNYLQAATVVRMIDETQKVRENSENLSEIDRIEMMFDFNGDGILGMKKDFYITEQQAVYHAFVSKTSGGIDAFFENIGLDKDVMLQEVVINPTRARKDIATVLAAAFESGVKGAELFVSGAELPEITPQDHTNEHFTGFWEVTNNKKDRERINTQKKMVASAEIMPYGIEDSAPAIELLVMDSMNISKISDGRSDSQVEIEKGKLIIGGSVKDLRIEEHIQGDKVEFILVIDGGVKDGDNFFMETGEKEVKTPFVSDTFTGNVEEKAEMLDKAAIQTTKQAREYLSQMIGSDALQHSKTVGMLDLQKMAFDLRSTGNTSIEEVWAQFNTVVNHKGFVAYLQERGLESKHANLINELESIVTSSEQVMVIQSMMANFMKKGHLVVNEAGETIMKSKSGKDVNILQYEKENNRSEFFDKIFEEKFPNLLPRIRSARESWYKVNGEKMKYTSQTINDGGIAFTGVSSKRKSEKNIHGVLPFSGMYNVAGEFIKIEGKSEEVVNSIPTANLEKLRYFLSNKFGVVLRNVDEVKDFINNGGNEKVSASYELAFGKMGECLNDSVFIQNLTFKKSATIDIQTISEVNEALYRFDTGGGNDGNGGEGGSSDTTNGATGNGDSDASTGNSDTSNDAGNNDF